MSVRISAPGGSREIRRVPIDGMVPGDPCVVDLEVVSDDAITSCLLACSVEDWAEVSIDDGATWAALLSDAQTGVELGPLAENEPRAFAVRVTVPGDLPVRRRVLELVLGLGV